MEIPTVVKPLLQGAALGAAALAILGFSWGGWVTASGAEELAKKRASSALVTALAPICVENFRRGKDSAEQLVALKKVRSWEQAEFVQKGGWAKMPGSSEPDTAMARACAELIVAEKT